MEFLAWLVRGVTFLPRLLYLEIYRRRMEFRYRRYWKGIRVRSRSGPTAG